MDFLFYAFIELLTFPLFSFTAAIAIAVVCNIAGLIFGTRFLIADALFELSGSPHHP